MVTKVPKSSLNLGISFSDAAPTSGTYAAGEVVFNSLVATVGQPTGWVCTVAGTPGTWVEFGSRYLNGSASPGAFTVNAGAEAAVSIPVAGATVGDFAQFSTSVTFGTMTSSCNVTSSGTVTVILSNATGGNITVASGVFYARVHKR